MVRVDNPPYSFVVTRVLGIKFSLGSLVCFRMRSLGGGIDIICSFFWYSSLGCFMKGFIFFLFAVMVVVRS